MSRKFSRLVSNRSWNGPSQEIKRLTFLSEPEHHSNNKNKLTSKTQPWITTEATRRNRKVRGQRQLAGKGTSICEYFRKVSLFCVSPFLLFAHIFISWCYYRHIGQQEGEVSLFNDAEAVNSLTESTSLLLTFCVRTIVSLACCCAFLLLLTNPSSSLLSSQTMECGEFMSEGTPLTNVSCVPTICLWDCMHVLLIHPLLLSLSVCLSPPRSCVGILLFW
jgi:hypothetical protein